MCVCVREIETEFLPTAPSSPYLAAWESSLERFHQFFCTVSELSCALR